MSLPRAAESKLRSECLEDRTVPATITVTTLLDDLTPQDGTVSLREALTAMECRQRSGAIRTLRRRAQAVFGVNDTIDFAVAGTIALGSALSGPINDDVSLIGPGRREPLRQRRRRRPSP